MKIAVTGAGGMLGKALMQELTKSSFLLINYSDAIGFTHDVLDILSPTEIHYQLKDFDVVINAAGEPNKAGLVNSLAPKYLHQALPNAKILHISTDCVFGAESTGLLAVDAKPVPDSPYGFSKLEGEVRGSKNFTSIRTSFIGPDHGLLKWFIDKDLEQRFSGEPSKIDGWARALWTGSTVGAVAEAIVEMLEHLDNLGEVEHLATPGVMSKFDALICLRILFNSNVHVVKTYDVAVNRALEHTIALAPLNTRGDELQDYHALAIGKDLIEANVSANA